MRADRPLRFGGLLIPTMGWDAARRRAIELEAAGFDLVTVDDHLSNPVAPMQPWSEAWSLLAGLAAVTESISIGPLVSNTILRHPALLARQALTVDEISGGRLELAIGAGYAPTDFAAVERPETSPDERAGRFAESVATIRALVDGRPAPSGQWHDLAGVALREPGGDRIPLTVAAHGRRALEVAARHADRWVSFGGWGLTSDRLLDVTRIRSATLDELCQTTGRTSPISRCLLAGSAAVCTDPIWTSVDAFEDFVGRFAGIGIDTFVFYWPPKWVSPDVDPAVVETVLADVIPRLRGTA